MEHYEKKGYLSSDFRLFHLTDRSIPNIKYHYHEFDKITILIKGNVHIPSRDEPISSNLTIWFLSAIMRFTARSSTQPRHMSGLLFTSLPLLLKITVHRTTTWDIVFKKQQKRNPVCFGFPLVKKVFCFRQSKDWKNPFPLMAMPTNSTGKFFF